jgi:hypothetical protein
MSEFDDVFEEFFDEEKPKKKEPKPPQPITQDLFTIKNNILAIIRKEETETTFKTIAKKSGIKDENLLIDALTDLLSDGIIFEPTADLFKLVVESEPSTPETIDNLTADDIDEMFAEEEKPTAPKTTPLTVIEHTDDRISPLADSEPVVQTNIADPPTKTGMDDFFADEEEKPEVEEPEVEESKVTEGHTTDEHCHTDTCMKCKLLKDNISGGSVQCYECDQKDPHAKPETEKWEIKSSSATHDVETLNIKESAKVAKKEADFIVTLDNIPKEFIVYIKGNPYICKAGLLWLGKKAGVKDIITESVIDSWTNDQKLAKYRATITMRSGAKFVQHGIAIPDGQNIKMATMLPFSDHLAETRAVNRVLRVATNCGFVSAEEMPDYERAE